MTPEISKTPILDAIKQLGFLMQDGFRSVESDYKIELTVSATKAKQISDEIKTHLEDLGLAVVKVDGMDTKATDFTEYKSAYQPTLIIKVV